MQPKAASTTAQTNGGEAAKERGEYSSRLSGAISSSMFSIGDLFKDLREGPKSIKFPKDLMKVLEQKLSEIAMGRDPACATFLISQGRPADNMPQLL